MVENIELQYIRLYNIANLTFVPDFVRTIYHVALQ